jgi:two-component system nitrogen regulation response regulator GlnG
MPRTCRPRSSALPRHGRRRLDASLAQWAEGESARAGARSRCSTPRCPSSSGTLIRVDAEAHPGSIARNAAKLLGWGRNTLTRKLKELGMYELLHGYSPSL